MDIVPALQPSVSSHVAVASARRVRSTLAAVLVGMALAGGLGCGTLAPGTTARFNLWHGGLLRQYRVYVPQNHDDATPAPLLFMLHGGGGSGRQLQQRSSRMDAEADRTGMLVVYADGFLHTWNGGGCCGPAANRQVDDVGFLLAVLEDVADKVGVDRTRIYASGMSNGAIMAYALACAHPEVMAAIAPVAGTRMVACEGGGAVPVMHIHGTRDKHVPWEGGRGCGPANVAFTGVEESVGRLAERAQCSAGTEVVSSDHGVECTRRLGCSGDSEVMVCRVQGGGHDWPGGEDSADILRRMCPDDGPQNREWNASAHMVDFLMRHRNAAAAR